MAAIQWGHAKRIFLWKEKEDFLVAINASYEPVGQETIVAVEGCFSVPGMRGKVRRWRRILAKYCDEKGTMHCRELADWPARVFQHETDHTNGILYDDEKAGKVEEKWSVS